MRLPDGLRLYAATCGIRTNYHQVDADYFTFGLNPLDKIHVIYSVRYNLLKRIKTENKNIDESFQTSIVCDDSCDESFSDS